MSIIRVVVTKLRRVLWKEYPGCTGRRVGMGLSVSGTFLQGLLGNPLADPYILGISSGAALGAAVSIVLGLGMLGTQALAFLASLATIYLVISLSRLGPGTSGTTLLLSGIAVSTFLSAVLSFIMLIFTGTIRRYSDDG